MSISSATAAFHLTAPVLPAIGAPLRPPSPPTSDFSSAAASRVDTILSLPEEQLDYGRAKLALDKIVDRPLDVATMAAKFNRMAKRALHMAGQGANGEAKLAALRKLIYQSGQWNGNRPFAYDQSDPDGQSIRARLISHYLATRLGNCVSMPILFLILGEKLGLDVALATAPLHIFVRYTDGRGRVFNLETTSGAHPARDEWIRQNFPMTDRALETGIYMRTLPRREAFAHMAAAVVELLIHEGRYQEAIGVSRSF